MCFVIATHHISSESAILTGVPFWVSERRISPDDNGLPLLNSPEPIFHNNSLFICVNMEMKLAIIVMRFMVFLTVYRNSKHS